MKQPTPKEIAFREIYRTILHQTTIGILAARLLSWDISSFHDKMITRSTFADGTILLISGCFILSSISKLRQLNK